MLLKRDGINCASGWRWVTKHTNRMSSLLSSSSTTRGSSQEQCNAQHEHKKKKKNNETERRMARRLNGMLFEILNTPSPITGTINIYKYLNRKFYGCALRRLVCMRTFGFGFWPLHSLYFTRANYFFLSLTFIWNIFLFVAVVYFDRQRFRLAALQAKFCTKRLTRGVTSTPKVESEREGTQNEFKLIRIVATAAASVSASAAAIRYTLFGLNPQIIMHSCDIERKLYA